MREVEQKWADGTVETMEDHWLNGAERNGYSRKIAQTIWDDVLKFAEYAFNKSHSAAYGILTMQTAWLKAHYPNEYMAAVLSSYTGKTDKIVHYVNACKQDGIAVLPPDINQSRGDFTAVPEGVRFGLSGLKGVGEKVVELIIEEREKNGRSPRCTISPSACRRGCQQACGRGACQGGRVRFDRLHAPSSSGAS